LQIDPSCQRGDDSARRILIAEDDRISALLLRRVLESRGYVVDHATDGIEAIRLQKEFNHKVVITDWMMPEMDGIELCRRIRDSRNSYVYVILLTAKSQKEDRTEAFESGIDDFLTKPLDKDDLIARLAVANRIISSEEILQRQNHELERLAERLSWSNHNFELASRRFEELFNGLPVACFTLDNLGMVFEWNRTAEQVFGVQPHVAFERSAWDVFGLKEHPLWNGQMVEEVFAGQSVTNFEWAYQRSDGRNIELQTNIIPLRGPNGQNIAAISVNVDVSDKNENARIVEKQIQVIHDYAERLQLEQKSLIVANERLECLAITDGLTGLWNHRHFQEEIDRISMNAQSSGTPVSLIMLDVDHFKLYNDSFGHPEGDEVLKAVSQILQTTTREGINCARYGGEEFVVLLDGVSHLAAIDIAERIRMGIESNKWKLGAVTASFGVSTLVSDKVNSKKLISNADEALYASKARGRNCVTHFDSIIENEDKAA
jgi:two-component system cell cycle response regulator